MNRSLIADAFDHHVWATLRLIDTCLELTPERLETTVPGTYGSILGTMRHLVSADSWYLVDIGGGAGRGIEADDMGLAELRSTMERDAGAWSDLLANNLDADAVVKEVDETDGFERDATVGVRLAQAIHHGTDHRSQICTALSSIGVEPPSIDVWEFGLTSGRSVERMPT